METFIVILALLGVMIILIAALPEPDETEQNIDTFNQFRDTINKKGN
jgi:hypothetical protein